ncbi:hypothetical protein [Clostridium saccharobutylicum]|uniref:Uncharacterized protein n=1 Tax=Clostridium saccharobutylicum TaxID=169679 RepID=A0A1S8MZ83_CLOSA|nr:hypothetical protein [Clostridium saccharobutylicum]OOM09403.1 hypothetical protein CLOSAC_36840 [Clostridium saccharobutylicum]
MRKKSKIINLDKYKKAKKLKNTKNKEIVKSDLTVEDVIIIDELKQEFESLIKKGGN